MISDSLELKAAFAGLCFGIWPLLLNQSGLKGNVASAVYGFMVLVIILVFTRDYTSVLTANWPVIACAGLVGAAGLLSFNSMLTTATKEQVSMLFVIMIIVQTCIPSLYHVLINWGASWSQISGFILAIAAAILLTRR